MSQIKITKSKYGSIEQIVVSSAEFRREALLTRFAGQRTWVMRGGYIGDSTLNIVGYDGDKTNFLKSDALKLARNWVERGQDFL